MFFSFEGIDGSGKTTQARLLADALRQRGQHVVEVREPGGTDLGERVRALVLDPDRRVDARAELLLFSAARAQLVADVVEPALASGAVVVADRFYDSSTAYQGGGRGLADPEWMGSLHTFATAGRSPDRTYFIDVPLATAAARRTRRSPDRMEQGDGAFYERVRASYLETARQDRVLTLDGTLSVPRLHTLIEADATSLQDADRLGGGNPTT